MKVSIELESDVAIVLFELLRSGQMLAEQLRLELPERNSFWELQTALERRLTSQLEPQIDLDLPAARQSMFERYRA